MKDPKDVLEAPRKKSIGDGRFAKQGYGTGVGKKRGEAGDASWKALGPTMMLDH